MPVTSYIPTHLYVSMVSSHNYWLAPLLGIAGLFFGAVFTGGISIYIEHYRHVKNKLATAYAFKGEISALLDIVEKRNFVGLLESLIKQKELIHQKLMKFYIAGSSIEQQKEIVKELSIDYLIRFSFLANEDVFYVKNSLRNEIGLLGEAAESVIRFYNLANAFLLDVEVNEKYNEEIKSRFWQGNSIQIIDRLYNFAKDFNMLYYAEVNGKIHESMFEMAKAIIDVGNEGIKKIDELIIKISPKNEGLNNIYKMNEQENKHFSPNSDKPLGKCKAIEKYLDRHLLYFLDTDNDRFSFKTLMYFIANLFVLSALMSIGLFWLGNNQYIGIVLILISVVLLSLAFIKWIFPFSRKIKNIFWMIIASVVFALIFLLIIHVFNTVLISNFEELIRLTRLKKP
jgi:hypothetical protein